MMKGKERRVAGGMSLSRRDGMRSSTRGKVLDFASSGDSSSVVMRREARSVGLVLGK